MFAQFFVGVLVTFQPLVRHTVEPSLICFSQVASYQQLREQYEGVRDGGMIPQKLVKRILGFLTAINSLEIYNVDSMEEMKAKRDELHSIMHHAGTVFRGVVRSSEDAERAEVSLFSFWFW